jgi:putative ABC transport system substrate-binding protein
MTALMLPVVAALGLAFVAAPLASEAQLPGKIPTIGILRSGSPPDPFVDAFRQGLRELGYVEGQSVRVEYRWAEGRDERPAPLASELIRLRVDVIVAGGSQAQ